MKTAEELRELQEKCRKKQVINWLLFAGMLLLLAFSVQAIRNSVVGNGDVRGVLYLLSISIVFSMMTAKSIFELSESFSKDVKRGIVEAASEGMFDSFSYDPDKGFNIEALERADMMVGIRSCGTDDMMTGEYNDVKFYRGDVSLNYGKNKMDTLHGTWTMYSFLKPIVSDLQITTKEMVIHSSVNRSIFTRKDEKRHLFITGDPEFDSVFACSGQDEREAMTLLTPMVRKRLIRLYQDTGLPIIVGWKGNTLHFITENALAPHGYSLYKNLDYDAMIADTRKKLFLTRRVIEELIMSRSVFSEYALEQYSMPVDAGHGEELRRQ